MVCVVLAMIATTRIRRDLKAYYYGIRPIYKLNKYLAVASLVLWTGAILAGRLMAYIGPVSDVDVS